MAYIVMAYVVMAYVVTLGATLSFRVAIESKKNVGMLWLGPKYVFAPKPKELLFASSFSNRHIADLKKKTV